jgi:exonuclease III
MNLLSYNVRGLGSLEKRKELNRLFLDKHPFIMCIHEKKLGCVDDSIVSSICDNSGFGYFFQPSVSMMIARVFCFNIC